LNYSIFSILPKRKPEKQKKIKTNSKSKTIMVILHRSKFEHLSLTKAILCSNKWEVPHLNSKFQMVNY